MEAPGSFWKPLGAPGSLCKHLGPWRTCVESSEQRKSHKVNHKSEFTFGMRSDCVLARLRTFLARLRKCDNGDFNDFPLQFKIKLNGTAKDMFGTAKP